MNIKLKNRLHRWNRMRIQVLLALLVLGIVPMMTASTRMVQNYRKEELNRNYEQVRQFCQDMGSRIQSGHLQSGSLAADHEAAIDMAAELYEGRILVVNAELQIVKDTFDREEGKTVISKEAVLATRGTESVYYNEEAQTVELVCPIREEQSGSVIGSIILTYSVEPAELMVAALTRSMMLFNTAMIVVIVVLALLLSARLTMPLKRLALLLRNFSDGDQQEKLVAAGSYEVEEIADSINGMLEEMRNTEQRRQEFVSNVSHELKTPLASMKVLADSLLMQEEVPNELYREFLGDINTEIDRENQIIQDLLELVRLDRREGEMHIAQVSMNELLEIVMRRLRPLAKQRDIEMIFESYRSVLAEVDEVKMSLVFTNIIENAIKYNRDGGSVRVTLNADHKYCYVRIEDTGVGIPEDSRKFVFDRFYRVDKARSRETGGTGLGLAIAKSAAMMHRGNIKVSSKEGVGSVFTVRIPLNFIPEYQAKTE